MSGIGLWSPALVLQDSAQVPPPAECLVLSLKVFEDERALWRAEGELVSRFGPAWTDFPGHEFVAASQVVCHALSIGGVVRTLRPLDCFVSVLRWLTGTPQREGRW